MNVSKYNDNTCIVVEKWLAIKSYSGSPSPTGPGWTPLKFNAGDVIDAVVNISDPTWMEVQDISFFSL